MVWITNSRKSRKINFKMKIGFDFDNTIVNYDNLFKLLLKKINNIGNLKINQVKIFF